MWLFLGAAVGGEVAGDGLVLFGGSSGFLVTGGLGVIWFRLVGCCWWESGVQWSGWCAGVGMFEGQCFGERK